MPRCLLAVLAALLAVSLWSTPSADACGMPLEASVPAEQALLSYADGREEMTLKVVLDTTGPNAALVTPVPGVPDKPSVVKGDIFGYLDEVTAPPERDSSGGGDGATAGAAPPGGVDVIGRDIVGEYDIARIASDDPDALAKWLDENGYTTPRGAQPIIDQYVREGWKFVAIKLKKGAKQDGPIEPVRVAFPSDEIVYPMRLDKLEGHQMDLDIYVNADEAVRLGGDQLEVQYAGPVSKLSKPPPADVRDLLPAPYLTRLHSVINPSVITADYVFAPAGAITVPEVGSKEGDSFPVLVIVLVVIPLLALTGFAVWLVRRRPGPRA